MKKYLLIPILFLAMSAQAQRPKLDTLASDKILLTYYVKHTLVNNGKDSTIYTPVTLETFKPGNKRYVLIDGRRVNIFYREPSDNKGHYEFAKF